MPSRGYASTLPALDPQSKKHNEQTAEVHTALAEVQTFVAKKMVEVARFTEGPASLAKEKVKALQKRLEDGPARLQQFRASTAERKRSHLLEDSASAADGIQP